MKQIYVTMARLKKFRVGLIWFGMVWFGSV